MTTVETPLNNVNLAAVGGLVQAIIDQPEKAQTTWGAQVQWTGGFSSQARVREFAPILSDEPAGLGGSDAAPNPVEQLLAALGNCLAVGYAANAAVAGIAIHELSISLDGDIDLRSFLGLAGGHAGFNAIRAVVDLKADGDDAAIEALHARVAASSPVGHTLTAPIELSITPA